MMHDRNHGQRQNSAEQTGDTSLPSTGRHDIPVEDAKGTKPDQNMSWHIEESNKYILLIKYYQVQLLTD